MLIRRKISLLFVLIIFLILMSNIVATSLIIQSTYEKELQSLRENELEKIKTELKDFVDITFEVAHTSYEKSADPQQIEQIYGDDLVHVIDMADSIADRYIELVRQGSLSTSVAQRQVMEAIRAMRYDSGTGYIWINDTGKPYPRMIMHPTAPHLNGEILDNPSFFCALGRDENLFKAFVDVCEEDGEGFVDYLWPKPTENGLTEEQPKLSYVRLIEEWDWIIGTGIYVDDAQKAAEAETLNVIRNMRYDDGVGYFFINNTERPFPRMIMHPTVPELDGQILDDPKYNCALGRNENLFVAFVDVCEEKGEGYVDYLWPKPTADGLTEEQPKLTYVRYFEPWDWIIGTGVYTDDIDQIIAGRQQELKEQLTRLNIFLAAISLLVAILAFIATPIFVKRLLGPLTNVGDTLKILSGGGGDLSFRLKAKGNDEVGLLSRHFNQFMETLSGLIAQVKTITGQNDRLSGNLLQTTELSSAVQEQINGNMRNISEKSGILDQDIAILNMVTGDMNSFINEVVNQITEQASAITESSAAIEEMSSSINNLERVTESKIELTEKLRGMASTGEDLMQETIKRIKAVGNSANIILELISVIDEITDRTNILAMNAAIEAAQAGEAGKGFAVVADEIRKLADSTAFNAREISVSLKGVIEEIKTSEASTLQTGDTFQSITEGVMDVTASMREIQNSMIELAEGGKQITISLSDLIRITEDVKTSSSGMTGKMGQVQKSLRSVTAISTQNKQGIEEVTQGIERLSRNTGIVNETGKENRELVEKLKATIGKFKLSEDTGNNP